MQMRPKERQGLTTGEVSKMLGISRNRVVTLFEQGTPTGYKHPVISWRVINRDSVEALAKELGIELSE
jgi:DNA-binding transcriptional regulator LsrR (DeoR family)